MTDERDTVRAPFRRNLWVWMGLLLLLALTAGSAYLRLGVWNLVANIAIAAAKAALVALFFMHLRASGALIRLAAVLALFMLVLLFSLGAADYLNRRIYPAPWQVPRQLQPLAQRSVPWSPRSSSLPAPRRASVEQPPSNSPGSTGA